MRASRIPVLLVVVAALVAAVLAVRSDEGGSSDPVAVDLRQLGPVVRGSEVIESTWYCAAGSGTDLTAGVEPDEEAEDTTTTTTAQDETTTTTAAEGESTTTTAPAEPAVETEPSPPVRAESTITIANLGDQPRQATVTIHPGRGEPVVVPVAVGPASVERIALADHAEGPALAAMVQVDGGDVAVARELVGDHGRDTGSCSATSSGEWHFAWGDTSRDMVEVIALFNPFAGDAVVDVRFATADGTREPRALSGLVVPARSVIIADVSAEVTVRDQVAATVTARSGRVVAERLQVADGSPRQADASGDEATLPTRTGLAVDLGTAAASEVVVHPFGRFAPDGVRQDVVVHNPSDEPAEVDVEISLGAEAVGGVEPFELSLPPRSAQVVHLADEQRLIDVFGEDTGRIGLRLRAVNGVPFVAEVVSTPIAGGLASSTQGALGGTELVFVEPRGSEPAATILALESLESEATTTVTLVVVDEGEREAVLEVELGPGERLELNDDDLDDLPVDAGALVVRSSSPITAELYSRWDDPADVSVRTGVPMTAGAARLADLVG